MNWAEESEGVIDLSKYFTISNSDDKEEFNIFNEDELEKIPDLDNIKTKIHSQNILNEFLQENENQEEDFKKLDVYLQNLGDKIIPSPSPHKQ